MQTKCFHSVMSHFAGIPIAIGTGRRKEKMTWKSKLTALTSLPAGRQVTGYFQTETLLFFQRLQVFVRKKVARCDWVQSRRNDASQHTRHGVKLLYICLNFPGGKQ